MYTAVLIMTMVVSPTNMLIVFGPFPSEEECIFRVKRLEQIYIDAIPIQTSKTRCKKEGDVS